MGGNHLESGVCCGEAGLCDGGAPWGVRGRGVRVRSRVARACAVVSKSTRGPASVRLILCGTWAPSLSLSFLICAVGACTAYWLCIWNRDAGKKEASGCPASFSRLLEASSAFWPEPRWPTASGCLQLFPS